VNREIALHVERLVLHGVAPERTTAVRRAIERELGRWFSEHGIPRDASAIEREVARAVQRAVTREGGGR
jgi:hypothetical protein